MRDVTSVEADLSGSWFLKTKHGSSQRGFTATAFSDKSNGSGAFNAEADLIDCAENVSRISGKIAGQPFAQIKFFGEFFDNNQRFFR